MLAIWEGVFSSFDEAGTRIDGHTNSLWIDKSVDRLEAETRSSELGGASLLAAVAGCTASSPTTVVDVGGNVGATFLRVSRQLPGKALRYVVLELDEFLQNPRVRSALLENVTYISSLGQLEQLPVADIAYFGSVIQYFAEWKTQLAEIVERSGAPKHLVFDDLMVGPQPSFVSNQTYYENQMSMWFLNEQEFITAVESLGYSLTLRRSFSVPGKNYFPPTSLPTAFRIPFAQSALFTRRD